MKTIDDLFSGVEEYPEPLVEQPETITPKAAPKTPTDYNVFKDFFIDAPMAAAESLYKTYVPSVKSTVMTGVYAANEQLREAPDTLSVSSMLEESLEINPLYAAFKKVAPDFRVGPESWQQPLIKGMFESRLREQFPQATDEQINRVFQKSKEVRNSPAMNFMDSFSEGLKEEITRIEQETLEKRRAIEEKYGRSLDRGTFEFAGLEFKTPSWTQLSMGMSDNLPTMTGALLFAAVRMKKQAAGTLTAAQSTRYKALIDGIVGIDSMREIAPIYMESREKGQSHSKALQKANLAYVGTALLDRAGLDTLLPKWTGASKLREALGDSRAAGLVATLARGAGGATAEGATEILQEAWQYAVGEDFKGSFEEFTEEVDLLEVFLIGGAQGGGMAMVSSVFEEHTRNQVRNLQDLEEQLFESQFPENPNYALGDEGVLSRIDEIGEQGGIAPISAEKKRQRVLDFASAREAQILEAQEDLDEDSPEFEKLAKELAFLRLNKENPGNIVEAYFTDPDLLDREAEVETEPETKPREQFWYDEPGEGTTAQTEEEAQAAAESDAEIDRAQKESEEAELAEKKKVPETERAASDIYGQAKETVEEAVEEVVEEPPMPAEETPRNKGFRKLAEDFTKKNKTGFNIRVVDEKSQLSPEIQKRAQLSTDPDFVSAGMYDPETDSVYLFSSKIKDAKQMRRFLLHEAVGHGGFARLFGGQEADLKQRVVQRKQMHGLLESVFGKEEAQKIADIKDSEQAMLYVLQKVYETDVAKRKMAAIAEEYGTPGKPLDMSLNEKGEPNNFGDFMLGMEEVFAALSETKGKDPKLWNRFIDAFKDLIYRLTGERMTNKQVQRLFEASRRAAQFGTSTTFAEAREIVEGGEAKAPRTAQQPKFAAKKKSEKENLEKKKKSYASPAADTPSKLSTMRKKIEKLAIEGTPGRFWYERSSEAIMKAVNGDKREAEVIAALLAVYSAQTAVYPNATAAIRAYQQYKATGTIKGIKTADQDRKAMRVINGERWEGVKTNNFYKNLMVTINPKLVQGVTVDLWMMRMLGFDSDAPKPGEYAWAEKEIARIADKLGWEPQQAQAAMWVASKDRWETIWPKIKSEAKAKKHLTQVVQKDGKKKWEWKTKEIEKQYRKKAMKQLHLIAQPEAGQGKFDFSDAFTRNAGRLSIESQPSAKLPGMPGIHSAAYEQRAEYHQAIEGVFNDIGGRDVMAQALGLLELDRAQAPGLWEGETSPSEQIQVQIPAKGSGKSKEVARETRALLNEWAAFQGLLRHQDGVAWHRPFYYDTDSDVTKKASNGIELAIDPAEEILPGQILEIEEVLNKNPKLVGAYAVVTAPGGVRILNFNASYANPEFHDFVENALANVDIPEAKLRLFRYEGDLVENNWSENRNGENYRKILSASPRSDLFRRYYEQFSKAINDINVEFSEKYGWGEPDKLADVLDPNLKLKQITQRDQRRVLGKNGRGKSRVFPASESSSGIQGASSKAWRSSKEYLKKFSKDFGIPKPQDREAVVDFQASTDIGFKYSDADEVNEDARAAYEQLAKEVEAQYQHIIENDGVQFIHTKDDPYPNSQAMRDDLQATNTLRVFKGGEDHPFMGKATKDKQGLTVTDKFRAVHDYYGHAAEANQFGPLGEQRAWLAHSQMFSPLARQAMTTETRWQNAWVNFGPHMWDMDGWRGDSDHPRFVAPKDRSFADQKAVLSPPEAVELDTGSVKAPRFARSTAIKMSPKPADEPSIKASDFFRDYENRRFNTDTVQDLLYYIVDNEPSNPFSKIAQALLSLPATPWSRAVLYSPVKEKFVDRSYADYMPVSSGGTRVPGLTYTPKEVVFEPDADLPTMIHEVMHAYTSSKIASRDLLHGRMDLSGEEYYKAVEETSDFDGGPMEALEAAYVYAIKKLAPTVAKNYLVDIIGNKTLFQKHGNINLLTNSEDEANEVRRVLMKRLEDADPYFAMSLTSEQFKVTEDETGSWSIIVSESGPLREKVLELFDVDERFFTGELPLGIIGETRDAMAVIEHNPEKFKDYYGFGDLHEFIAEAFSNPEFQLKLDSLAVPDISGTRPRRTLYQVFKDAVRKLFYPYGDPSPDAESQSLLDLVIDVTEQIVREEDNKGMVTSFSTPVARRFNLQRQYEAADEAEKGRMILEKAKQTLPGVLVENVDGQAYRFGSKATHRYITGQSVAVHMHHGTPYGPIEEFDPTKGGEYTQARDAEMGYFFAGAKKTATWYSNGTVNSLASLIPHKSLAFLHEQDRQFITDAFTQIHDHLLNGSEVYPEFQKYADKFREAGEIPRYLSQWLPTLSDADVEAVVKTLYPDMKYDASRIEPTVHSVFVVMENPLVYNFEGANYDEAKYVDLIEQAVAEGHDGVIIEKVRDGGGVDNVVIVPHGYENNVKSSDAITYEPDGSEVPFDDRFDLSRKTIRHAGEKGANQPEGTDRHKFSTRFEKDPDLTPEVIEGIKNKWYTVEPNAKTRDAVLDYVEEFGVVKAAQAFADPKSDLPGAQRIALGIFLARMHNEHVKLFKQSGMEEDAADHAEKAVLVVEKLNEYGLEAGRTVQAFTMMADVVMAAPELAQRVYLRAVQESREKDLRYDESNIKQVEEAVADVNEAVMSATFDSATVRSEVRRILKKYSAQAADEARKIVKKSSKLRDHFKSRLKKPNIKFAKKSRELSLEQKLDAAAKYGAQQFLAMGGPSQKDWNAQMLSDFGEDVRPYLVDIYQRSTLLAQKLATQYSQQSSSGASVDIDELAAKIMQKQTSTVRSIVLKSIQQQGLDFTALADSLSQNLGLSDQDARLLAMTLRDRFNQSAAPAAREAALKQRLGPILGTVKKGTQAKKKELVEQIVELVNLGAVTNQTYRDAFAEKLGYAQVDPAVLDEIRQRAEAVNDLPEGSLQRFDAGADLMSYISESQGIKPTDVFWGLWYARILSSPNTHILNVLSTGTNTITNIFAHSKGNPKLLWYGLAGAYHGASVGYREFRHGMATGKTLLRGDLKYDHRPTLEMNPLHKFMSKSPVAPRIMGNLGKILDSWKYIGRALLSEDVFWYKTAQESRRFMLAYEAAKSAGTTQGPAFQAAFDQLLARDEPTMQTFRDQANRENLTGRDFERRVRQLQEINTSGKILDPAKGISPADFAAQSTFTSMPDGILGMLAIKIAEAHGDIPGLRFIVPFTRVVANVANMSIDYSPWGYVRLAGIPEGRGKWRKPKDDEFSARLAKAHMGMAFMMAAYLMDAWAAEEDEEDPWFAITGNGPPNRQKQYQLREQGWRPYSVKIGNRYFSYRATPFLIPFAIIGRARDLDRYEEWDEQDAMTKIAAMGIAGAQTIIDQSFLSGVAGLMETLVRAGDTESSAKQAERFFAPHVKGIVASNLSTFLYQSIDSTLFTTDDFKSVVLRSIPGAAAMAGLKPRLNLLGEPIKLSKGVPIVNKFITKQTADPVWDMLARKKVFIMGMSDITIDGEAASEDFQYDYAEQAGQSLRAWLEKQVEYGSFETLPTLEIQEQIDAKTRQIRNSTKKKLKRAYLARGDAINRE